MGNWTKGTWELTTNENGTHHIDADWINICDLYHVERNGPGIFTKENAIANGHLISASPDMAEALESALVKLNEFYEQWGPQEGEDIKAVITQCENALSKAKGE